MAIVKKYGDVNVEPVMDGVGMRMVIGPEDGAPHFNMRIFDIEPGASTPHHSHWWEHETFVIEGEGIVRTDQGDVSLKAGHAVFMPGNEVHQFVNTGESVLKMMCLVPQKWLEDTTGKPTI